MVSKTKSEGSNPSTSAKQEPKLSNKIGGGGTRNWREEKERLENLKNPPSVNRPEERDGFSEISMNHRMSNLHAAVGLAQLERLEENIKKKIKTIIPSRIKNRIKTKS